MEAIRRPIRAVMRRLARGLNTATEGKLSPNAVTVFGLCMHFPIALLIASGDLFSAGILLAVFGLLDTLDGELARLQKKETKFGMFLDSVTDRAKEILVYLGISYYFVSQHEPMFAVWAVAALGAGLLTSYINAWGDAVVGSSKKSGDANKAFRGGLLTFDIRMFVLVVGLVFELLNWIVPALAILSVITILQRTIIVSRRLR